jgi:hypothetical protein
MVGVISAGMPRRQSSAAIDVVAASVWPPQSHFLFVPQKFFSLFPLIAIGTSPRPLVPLLFPGEKRGGKKKVFRRVASRSPPSSSPLGPFSPLDGAGHDDQHGEADGAGPGLCRVGVALASADIFTCVEEEEDVSRKFPAMTFRLNPFQALFLSSTEGRKR